MCVFPNTAGSISTAVTLKKLNSYSRLNFHSNDIIQAQLIQQDQFHSSLIIHSSDIEKRECVLKWNIFNIIILFHVRGNWKFRQFKFYSNAVESKSAVSKEIPPPPPGIWINNLSWYCWRRMVGMQLIEKLEGNLTFSEILFTVIFPILRTLLWD